MIDLDDGAREHIFSCKGLVDAKDLVDACKHAEFAKGKGRFRKLKLYELLKEGKEAAFEKAWNLLRFMKELLGAYLINLNYRAHPNDPATTLPTRV